MKGEPRIYGQSVNQTIIIQSVTLNINRKVAFTEKKHLEEIFS